MDWINEKRKEFRDGLKTDFFRKNKFDCNNLDAFQEAVKAGYGDAKRTFTGIGKLWSDAQRNEFFKALAGELQKQFTSEPEATWHEDLCSYFCTELSKLGYKTVTYGQAQKVINMALKYLFCMEDAEQYDLFKQCHMPLDSFTLSWYHKAAKKAGKKPPITREHKWSRLNAENYSAVQTMIGSILDSNCTIMIDGEEIVLPKEPLWAECIIWPEEILLAAGNGFMSAINKDYPKCQSDSMALFKEILCKELPRYCNLNITISKKP